MELGIGQRNNNAPRTVLACVFGLVFLFSLMSLLRGSLFGGPSNFQQSQLPTYEQVGKQFLQTKNELKAKSPQIRN